MKRLPLLAAATALLALGACAATPRVDPLAGLRGEVLSASNDSAVNTYAPVPLHEATQALERAEAAQSANDGPLRDHWAFMARNHLAIARSEAAAEDARTRRQRLAERMEMEGALGQPPALATAAGPTLTLSGQIFEPGRASLRAGAANRLAPLASYLRDHPDATVTIEGHDSAGGETAALALSLARAERVRDYLIGEGVEPARIIARGMGSFHPVANDATMAGRMQNSRVEVFVAEGLASR